jgi:hypothetical protein
MKTVLDDEADAIAIQLDEDVLSAITTASTVSRG